MLTSIYWYSSTPLYYLAHGNKSNIDNTIHIARKRKNRKVERLRNLVVKIDEVHRHEPETAIEQSSEALKLADELGDLEARFEVLLCLGRVYARQGDFAKSESLLRECLGLVPDKETGKDNLCRIYIVLGAVHFFQEKNDMALDFYFKALATDVTEQKGRINLNIANIYFTNKNYNKSLQYQKKALNIFEASNDYDHLIFSLSNIGAIYVHLGDFEHALKYFENALESIRKYGGNDYMRCSCLLNLGEVRRRLDFLVEAEDHYKEALQLARTNKLTRELAQGYQYLGELKLRTKEVNSFLYYQYRSRKICLEYGFDGIRMEVLSNLQRFFENNSDYKKSYEYLKEITSLRESIETVRQEKELSNLLDHKEKEISILGEQKSQIENQKIRLENSNKELEKYNRELEQYAYVVAHDLKEPLRNISSFTSLIKHRYTDKLDDTAQEYMGYVVRNVAQMHSLLTELLRYNTVERKDTKNEEIELGDAMQLVVDQLKVQIEEKSASILIGDLPRLRIHQVHVMQLFQNLIKNALQFNESDKCIIKIHSERHGEFYKFSVSDNGIGIQEDYHEKIFKLFNRLDKENYEGTGIGLALCKKIVQIYEGEIWIESKPGMGSTFFFTLKA